MRYRPETIARRTRGSLAGLLAVLVALSGVSAAPGAAQDEVPTLVDDSIAALSALVADEGGHCVRHDAADAETDEDVELPYVLCDDGVVPEGGGANGIPVPVAYQPRAAGNDWRGLPPPATPEEAAAADASYDLQPEADRPDRITLDVDITLPVVGPPKSGYPVIVFMHGCCGGNRKGWQASDIHVTGEMWHHSNAWFASRGYVVINYTARGFRNSSNQGSTGTTQLDSRRFEINDYQYLVGLLVDHDAQRRAAGERPVFRVNPRKIAAVGGSYGGGFSWMALTDPTWRSPSERIPIRLGAVAPRYGWTDLLEALVPSGHYLDRDPKSGRTAIMPTSVVDAVSRKPLGVMKQSIVSGLYATGNNESGNHTTFPAWVHDAVARLQLGDPYDGDPNLEQAAEWLLEDRSAYYQQDFWRRVRNGLRVPIHASVTWTDPLFTTMQSGIAFYNKLRSIAPKYPIQMYLGDYQHFVANKAKEWDDLCGNDHHICELGDFRRADGSVNLNAAPSRVRVGINTRGARFLGHYLLGSGPRPARDVSATTTVCAANATEKFPVDEPGIEYRAKTWRGLAPDTIRFAWQGGGVVTTTSSSTATDNHATESDPVFRQTQSNRCFTTSNSEAAPGVVQYEDVVPATFTLMGLPQLRLDYTTTATD
ncbi:MAG: hypothetical protein M3161_01590, partial [Actinomycetota bacterium]|nr:hypothetical protein [Actinomycetota bacterium]